MRLYHFFFEPDSERVRLALGLMSLPYELKVVDPDDDETFFDLGVARTAPVLQWDDGQLALESLAILAELDRRYPERALFGPLNAEQWQALTAWRARGSVLWDRLYAPIRPAYRGIGDSEGHLAAYKASVQARFHTSLEDLANDRYAVYQQLDALTGLKALGAFLAKHRFYAGTPSAADALLAADLFPLQLLDGVTLPIDLMYYCERVQESCGVDLRQGFLSDA